MNMIYKIDLTRELQDIHNLFCSVLGELARELENSKNIMFVPFNRKIITNRDIEYYRQKGVALSVTPILPYLGLDVVERYVMANIYPDTIDFRLNTLLRKQKKGLGRQFARSKHFPLEDILDFEILDALGYGTKDCYLFDSLDKTVNTCFDRIAEIHVNHPNNLIHVDLYGYYTYVSIGESILEYRYKEALNAL